MNALETIELIKVLRQSGATHFKSNDFEVTLGGDVSELPPKAEAKPVEQPEGNPQATEKIKDLISTLKMNNEELLDKIFPNGAGG